MKVIYTGPHDAVDVPVARVQAVRDGDPVEVDKAIGEALVACGDFVEHKPPKASPKP